MRLIRWLTLLFLTLHVGCQSVPQRGPASEKPADAEVPIHTQARWLRDYKWAKSNSVTSPEKACSLFLALAGEDRFPGHQLADLRSYAACSQSGTQTKLKPLDRTSYPDWLQDLALDVALKWVQSYGDKAVEMDLAAEKSRQRLPQNEKTEWIHLAIERAEELKEQDKLKDLKRRLYMIAPRLNPAPDKKDYPAVAQDLRMARQFKKARSYYWKILKGREFSFNEKLSAHKGLRLSYKNARQDLEHIKSAAALVRFLKAALKRSPKSQEILLAAYDAQMYLGRALWTLGKTADARHVFNGLEAMMKGKLSLAELYWIKGRMAEEARDFETVSKYMEKALTEEITEPELRDKILWYAAWNERKRGNPARAIDWLNELDQKTEVDFTRVRAVFWLGKTYRADKKEDQAKKAFTRLIDIDPLGYYGLLAHAELGIPIALPRQLAAAQAKTPAVAVQIPLDTGLAEWLRLLDEKDVLTALLDRAADEYKKSKNQSDEGWSTLFRYYAKAGLFMKLYENMGSVSPERRKLILESHPELLFPQPWSEEVRTAAVQFGIDEELIFAIMRQESAFNTQARSLADAFGLMQVLPELAERLSPRFNIPYNDLDDLFEPKTNISVGTAHLKELLHRHQGRYIPAVASYNASESVINHWVKSRFHGDPLEFVEEIPYEETRGYVRLVLRNMTFYTLLRSKTPSIAFPARLWRMTSDPAE